MPNFPDQSYADGFSSLIHVLSQQKGSKLQNAVRNETRNLNVDFFERLGSTEVSEKTSRFSDSPTTDVPHSRRKLSYGDFQHYPFLDKQEDQRLLIDPKSKYVQSGIMAFGRKKDLLIAEAALGNAFSGKDGSTSVALGGDQQISAGGTGLTVAKLREAREILGLADVDLDEPRFIAVTAIQITNLLEDEQITSSDFNTVRALVAGDIDTFMGFKFIEVSPKIINLSSTTRECFAWSKNGIILGTGGTTSRTVIRDDKSGAWQNQMDMALGSTRMEEELVVQIDCDES